MRYRRAFGLSGVAGLLAVGATAVAMAAVGTLHGAGSTLVAPLEAKWAAAFHASTGSTVSYAAMGSGFGISAIAAGTVDFGASDAPLTPTQPSGCHGCVQIPWALTGVALGYHLNGVGRLKLTGNLLAEIYLGQITKWNTPQIKALNAGVRLPNLKITPIFRVDDSGDTYAFTSYLSRVNPAWRSKVGSGTTVTFPGGMSGRGNSGVTGLLNSTNGGLAYVAAPYLIAQGALATAAIQNAAGRFEYPNLSNIESAAQTVRSVPAGNALPIVDPPRSAAAAYPISTFTYVIAPKSAAKAALLKQWITYALTTAQKYGAALDFAPIPGVVLKQAKRTRTGLK